VEERQAERAYEKDRRKRRVQVFASSPEERRAWAVRARRSGFGTTGEWAASVLRREVQETADRQAEHDAWKERALRAEAEAALLRRRLELLEQAVRPERPDAAG